MHDFYIRAGHSNFKDPIFLQSNISHQSKPDQHGHENFYRGVVVDILLAIGRKVSYSPESRKTLSQPQDSEIGIQRGECLLNKRFIYGELCGF